MPLREFGARLSPGQAARHTGEPSWIRTSDLLIKRSLVLKSVQRLTDFIETFVLSYSFAEPKAQRLPHISPTLDRVNVFISWSKLLRLPALLATHTRHHTFQPCVLVSASVVTHMWAHSSVGRATDFVWESPSGNRRVRRCQSRGTRPRRGDGNPEPSPSDGEGVEARRHPPNSLRGDTVKGWSRPRTPGTGAAKAEVGG